MLFHTFPSKPDDTGQPSVVYISHEASQRISFSTRVVPINCKLLTRAHKRLHTTVLSSYFLNSLVYRALQERETFISPLQMYVP
jgi:hypothetical protein